MASGDSNRDGKHGEHSKINSIDPNTPTYEENHERTLEEFRDLYGTENQASPTEKELYDRFYGTDSSELDREIQKMPPALEREERFIAHKTKTYEEEFEREKPGHGYSYREVKVEKEDGGISVTKTRFEALEGYKTGEFGGEKHADGSTSLHAKGEVRASLGRLEHESYSADDGGYRHVNLSGEVLGAKGHAGGSAHIEADRSTFKGRIDGEMNVIKGTGTIGGGGLTDDYALGVETTGNVEYGAKGGTGFEWDDRDGLNPEGTHHSAPKPKWDLSGKVEGKYESYDMGDKEGKQILRDHNYDAEADEKYLDDDTLLRHENRVYDKQLGPNPIPHTNSPVDTRSGTDDRNIGEMPLSSSEPDSLLTGEMSPPFADMSGQAEKWAASNVSDRGEASNERTPSSQVSETEHQETTAQGILEDLERDKTTAQGNVDETEESKTTAQSNVDETEDSKTTAQGNVDETEDSKTTAQGNVDETEDSKTTAQGNVDETEDSKTTAQGNVDETEDSKTTAQGNVDETEDSKTTAQGNVDETEDSKTTAQGNVDETEDLQDHGPGQCR